MVTPYADGRKKGATRPSFLIATKACPGLRSGMRLKGFRVRRRTPTFVIPAKAGIHALIFRERTSTAKTPPKSTRRPHFVIGTKMTLPALDRDFETHQSSQSSFPRRRESTHESRAAKRQSRNRRHSPQGQCSAGACSPLGLGRGVAESNAPTRPTKSQLRLFIPRCAGASRDERLVRE